MKTLLNEQIAALLEETDMIAALANVSACIYQSYENINWAGFYFVKHDELVLGPFQGKPACTHISFNNGVCGKCYRDKAVMRIDDVETFPGHIACDSASRSELCVPVIINDQVIMEIDIDSPSKNRFTEQEEKEMLASAEDIATAFRKHSWKI